MTVQQFSKLNRQQQKVQLLVKGTFVDERRTGAFDVMLYELNGLYAEVYFRKHTNRLVFIRPLLSTDELTPYLDKIDVTGLLHNPPS